MFLKVSRLRRCFLCFYLIFYGYLNVAGASFLCSNDICIGNSKESVKKIKNNTNRSIDNDALVDILKKNADRMMMIVYTDYYCIACDSVHKKIECLKSKVRGIDIKYEIVALTQKSVEAAYVALYFKNIGIFRSFNGVMYKMDYVERNVERACASLGYSLSSIMKFDSMTLKLFREKIILNNRFLEKFSNGIAPLLVIKLFRDKKKKFLMRESFITGDFSVSSLYKSVKALF